MIGVNGQFVLSFSMDNKKDFIQTNHFMEFTIIEECGNLLPTWKIVFKAFDTSLTPYWHEGNVIKVAYGVKKEEMIETNLVITEKSIIPDGNDRYIYTAVGLYAALPFVNVPHTRTIGPYSAAVFINGIASQYFKLDKNNLKESSDSQIWIQSNISDKRVLDEALRKIYIKDSFAGSGITSDGRFILTDVKKLIQSDYKYRFTQTTEDKDKDITFVGNPIHTSNSSFINSWVGYGREKHIQYLESGDMLVHRPKGNTLLSMSGKLQRSTLIEKIPLPQVPISRNVDCNTVIGSSNNITNLALLSSECSTLTFTNLFKPISIWDLVMLKESNPQNRSEDNVSGLHIVGLVARTVSGVPNFRLDTTVQLFRDSNNKIEGSVK